MCTRQCRQPRWQGRKVPHINQHQENKLNQPQPHTYDKTDFHDHHPSFMPTPCHPQLSWTSLCMRSPMLVIILCCDHADIPPGHIVIVYVGEWYSSDVHTNALAHCWNTLRINMQSKPLFALMPWILWTSTLFTLSCQHSGFPIWIMGMIHVCWSICGSTFAICDYCVSLGICAHKQLCLLLVCVLILLLLLLLWLC